jgi:hypothetical protein
MTGKTGRCDPGAFDVIFLDMGGVFVRDEAIEARYLWGVYSELKRKKYNITPELLFAERERALSGGRIEWLQPFAEPILGSPGWSRAMADSWADVLADWIDLAVSILGACAAITRCCRQRQRPSRIIRRLVWCRSLVSQIDIQVKE